VYKTNQTHATKHSGQIHRQAGEAIYLPRNPGLTLLMRFVNSRCVTSGDYQ